MKSKRWLLIAALIITALLLGGCINIKQEYWLNADGSAKVGMDIGMSEALLSMGNSSSGSKSSPFDSLKKEYSTPNPKIKNVKTREYKEGDLQHFEVTFETASFDEFLASQSKSSSGQLNITLTKLSNGNIQFKQITKLDQAQTGSTSGMDAKSLESAFKDMYWTVIVHVPTLISSNGIKLDNQTVQWKIPMLDVFTGKAPAALTLEYSTKGGNPAGGSGDMGWLVWVVLVLVLLVLGGGAAYYFLVLRKRPARPAPAGYHPGGAPVSPAGPYAGYPPPGGQPLAQPGFPPPQYPNPGQAGFPTPQGFTPPPAQVPPQGGQPPAQPGFPPPQYPNPGQAGFPTMQGFTPPPAQYPPQAGQPPAAQPGWAPPQYPDPSQAGSTISQGLTPPPPQAPPGQAPAQPPEAPQYPQYPQGPQFPQYPPQAGYPQYGYPPQQPPPPENPEQK